MNKTIGILAHVDAGKTTFSEQLLFHTNSIRQAGRVDHQDAFLDSHAIEKNRGITIFADQATISYNGSTYFLIDTPGHVDFSTEMERSLQVMDYAILLISAADGLESHTETVWHLLKKHQVPTFLFINKTDREGANPEQVLEQIRTELSEDICDITSSSLDGDMAEELIEFIAERDEVILEQYLTTGFDDTLWLKALKKMISNRQLFACAHGSALKDSGILEFFKQLDCLTETVYPIDESFSALAYKIRHDDNGNRLTFLKALNGSLRVRDEVIYGKEEMQTQDKVTQLRIYNGLKFHSVDEVHAGELFAAAGISNLSIGGTLGDCQEKAGSEMVPTLKSKVFFDSSLRAKEVLKSFQLLDAEDPSLSVEWDEHFQEIHIHVMGVIQLEVLTQIVKERFGFTVSFGNPEILYKETVASTVVGYGHFEPLRHYAEVHLKIEPGERDSGIQLANSCHADALSTGYQNAVLNHLVERDHHGLLTGSPLTDVKITLLTGRGHNEHTSGGDFREATFRALRQGLEKAENKLLEPVYRFKIKVEMELMGKILADLQQANGRFEPPEMTGGKAIVRGTVPVINFMDYPAEFASATRGKGSLSLVFGGYDFCHNEKEIIEKINYNKEADPEYTSTSIFCAKGQGYKVPWYEAEAAMHCL